jgi:two-component system response regulator NreC
VSSHLHLAATDRDAEEERRPITVVLADDHPLFRRTLRHALEGDETMSVIVVLTMEDNAPLAQELVAAGEEFISSRVPTGVEALRRSNDRGLLSPREIEIVRLIALGHTSVEIAAMLHLSRRTVETHRARIFHKLGLTTRAELVRFALDRRLIGG